MTDTEYIKCYPCFNKDVNGNIINDKTINDPYNLNGAGSKCQTFDSSFPNKNTRPKDYLVCKQSNKLGDTGCGNQEVIVSSTTNIPIKKSNTVGTLVLSILGIISIYSIIMWIIYRAART
jgi:hypothetical protein